MNMTLGKNNSGDEGEEPWALKAFESCLPISCRWTIQIVDFFLPTWSQADLFRRKALLRGCHFNQQAIASLSSWWGKLTFLSCCERIKTWEQVPYTFFLIYLRWHLGFRLHSFFFTKNTLLYCNFFWTVLWNMVWEFLL